MVETGSMSESGNRDAAARQKRVQRLKKTILIVLFTLILLPYLFCVLLLVQIRKLNVRVEELSTAYLQQSQSRLDMPQQTGQATEKTEQVQVSVTEQGSAPGHEILPVQTPLDGTDSGGTDEQSGWHKVYLTFDDGPSPNTDKILDILAEYDVKATFFVVGKEGENSRQAINRIVEEGHTLGMHSYSHRYADLYASLDNFEADFLKERDYLEELTGARPRLYRFPGGSSNKVSPLDMKIFADYLDTQDVVFYDWNISSGDGGKKLLSVDELVKNSTGDIEKWSTAVILLHDSADKPTTVEALPDIIEKILATEDAVILPITEDTVPVQHIHKDE